jgi:hypothetical protein
MAAVGCYVTVHKMAQTRMKSTPHLLLGSLRFGRLLGYLLVCLALPAPARAAEWDTFVEGYLTEYFRLHPDAAVKAGRHEFDGQLPDWTPAGIRKTAEFLEAQRASAAEFKDLNQRQQFEREYLRAEIDRELFWLVKARQPFKNPMFYVGLGSGLDPSVYVLREYGTPPARLKGFVGYARRIPAAIEQIKRNLKPPLPKTYVDIGRAVFGGLTGYVEKDVPAVFASVDDKELQQDFAAANTRAVAALKDITEWFESLRASADDRYALGADLFEQMLRDTERVDVPLAELERIGKADLERNLTALEEACADYAPGKTVAEALELMRHHKPPEGPVTGARKQLASLKQFLIDHDVVTIPSREEARVEESPPFARWNFAYIDIPGPYEKTAMSETVESLKRGVSPQLP